MAPKRRDDPLESEPKKMKFSQESEWQEQPPSLIFRVPTSVPVSNKIAAFDLNGTLVNMESDFKPVSAEDMFKANVPKVLTNLHNEGYRLVIFANEGSIRSKLDSRAASKIKTRYDEVLDALELPISVYIATDKGVFFKPNTGMWDYMCAHHCRNMPPDRTSSFYVGSEAGREGDASAADKEFAARMGIAFKTPEQCFGQHVNAPLCALFDLLAKDALSSGDKYESRGFKKVSAALAALSGPVQAGKDIAGVAGITKKSISMIDEWISSGKIQAVVDIQAADAANAEDDDPDAGEEEADDDDEEVV